MSAEHFTELIETFYMTTKLTRDKVADILDVNPHTITRWKKDGVPKGRALMVSTALRNTIGR